MILYQLRYRSNPLLPLNYYFKTLSKVREDDLCLHIWWDFNEFLNTIKVPYFFVRKSIRKSRLENKALKHKALGSSF